MMPKLPELPFVEGSPDGDLPPSAVRAWALSYARECVEECVKIADTHAVVKAEGPARTACEMVAAAIRKAAEELGK